LSEATPAQETTLRLSAMGMEFTGRTSTKISVLRECFTEFPRRVPRCKPCQTVGEQQGRADP
jgi:hypothetical protein